MKKLKADIQSIIADLNYSVKVCRKNELLKSNKSNLKSTKEEILSIRKRCLKNKQIKSLPTKRKEKESDSRESKARLRSSS